MTASPRHPLTAQDVLARTGRPLLDSDVVATCPDCGTEQRLSEARLERAERPEDISAYRCLNGCRVLVVTGHPLPLPGLGGKRYVLGDYAIEGMVP